MVTRRSGVLILALLFLSPLHCTADPHTLSVGLLSARDARPVAQVAPFVPDGELFATLVPARGEPTQRRLSGDVFLALGGAEPVRSAAAESRPFSVQVASLGSAEAAEEVAAGVRAHWPEKDVRVNAAQLGDGRTTHRVLAGRFAHRNRALAFTTDLAAYHLDGAFVVQLDPTGDGTAAAGGRPLVLYNRATGLVTDLRLVAFSAAGSGGDDPGFRLDGSPYRGTLEVRGGSAGIVAVNLVDLEAYLEGVVPCELGPQHFPQLEALKAQAVAARTYALKHSGRHRSEGFDLCDTPHCQVYGGAGREHPLSSEAVRQTAGLVGYHDGELAETLYTSTCGGHTEVSSAVFSGEAPPYLTGVPCTVDSERAQVTIGPELLRPPKAGKEAESGIDLGFALDLLERLGLPVAPTDLHRPVLADEAADWIRVVTGRLAGAAEGERPPGRSTLAGMVCRSLGWSERLTLLYSQEDAEEITGSADQLALAHLLHERIFLQLPDGGAGGSAAMSRGRFAAALARLALHLDPTLLQDGVLQRAEGRVLHFRVGEERFSPPISQQGLSLFERRGEVYRPIAPDRLRSGDRVRFHREDRMGFVDLLVRLPAEDGAAADRYSPYNRWSIIVPREEIEKLLEGNGHRIGQLVDLEPLERGATGRLVRLMAVGTRTRVILRGLDIRWNLGTRENLFFIDRVTGADGSIRRYRFTGRGWGHGVGMCQVGAAGLADAGASFVEILQHYYPGIRIEQAVGVAP